MADRWMDERDRETRDRDWRRGERHRGYASEYERGGAPEDRSWRTEGRDYGDRSYPEPGYAGRRGYGRDRVFGERETGASYTSTGGSAYGAPRRTYDRGVSEADFDDSYAAGYGLAGLRYGGGPNDMRGGRYYGDDARQPIYEEEYGQGGADYGPARDYGAYARPPYGGREAFRREDRRFEHHTPNVREGRGEGGRGWWDRARDQFASWFGDDDAQRRHEWDARASHRGRGPRGYRRSDQRISDDVHDRLTDDPWLDASAIVVAVKDGEVTLTGMVADRNAKHHAERIIEDVSGVDHVQNNLRIETGGGAGVGSSNPITGAGRGFGDSVLQAQAEGRTPGEGDGQKAKGPTTTN